MKPVSGVNAPHMSSSRSHSCRRVRVMDGTSMDARFNSSARASSTSKGARAGKLSVSVSAKVTLLRGLRTAVYLSRRPGLDRWGGL